jgi:DNA-binding SARP family transcriptional activator/pimeloyl-ACP methyl ester carboxylesterase
VPPLAQNIELMWERVEYRSMLARLGSFARMLHFDKRGTGASDRTASMPTVDERVEDLRVIMDDAHIERAHVLGVSEGGPIALAFAATYPDRVVGAVVVSSGARVIGEETAEQREGRRRWNSMFVDRWGTDDSITLDVFAPSLASDQSYRAWEPRYERHCSSPGAMAELLEMMEAIDVRPLLPMINCPILALHRVGDPVVPVERAREVAAGGVDVRVVELDGKDHLAQAGDVHAWLDHLEAFVTGSVNRDAGLGRPPRGPVEIQTLGGFVVRVGGVEVPLTAWGSRRARQLCKRIAVASGQPVARDELIEMLWPGEPEQSRLGARLSVLLSNVRRVLGGGIIADRDAVRLDLNAVELDLRVLREALDGGDDRAAVQAYRGPALPEDAYDDWAIAARERAQLAIIGAHRRLAAAAVSTDNVDTVVAHTSAILDLDPFDDSAHELLVRTLAASDRRADASRAEMRYRQRMSELGVRPRDLLDRSLES